MTNVDEEIDALVEWYGKDSKAAHMLLALKARAEAAEKRVKTVVRSRESSRRFWLRAARKALDGDMRELRNRVELCEAGPLDLVLSSLRDEEAKP